MFYPAVDCTGGVCPAQSGQNCDDQNICTDDSCDPAIGCTNTPNISTKCHAAYCDNLLWYDEVLCVGDGSCPTQVLTEDCDDGNLCTDDNCNPLTGCSHLPHVGTCPSDFPPCECICVGTVCICEDEELNCLDDDCDGYIDEDFDLDHDGVCDECTVDEVDTCPTVWNPNNDSGVCPALGGGWASSRPIVLSESGFASTSRRTNEPVEVPLRNGILDDSVIGYWKIDGGQAKDSSGNGNDGTVSLVGVTAAVGAFGGLDGGLDLDGGYVTLASVDADFGAVEALTVMVWLKLHKTITEKNQALLSKFRADSCTFLLSVTKDDTIQFSVCDGVGKTHTVFSKTKVTLGEWMMVAGIYDGKSSRVYIDGVLDPALGEDSGGFDGGKLAVSEATVYLGACDNCYSADGSTNPDYLLNGELDEALVFNRALTPTEIAAYYNSHMPYGASMVPGAQPDFDDVRITEVSPQQAEHVIPHEILGPCPHSDTECPYPDPTDAPGLADRDDLCGVVGYWKLDGDGKDATKALDLLDVGIPAFLRGRFGDTYGALTPTTENYLKVESAAYLGGGAVSLTVEMWVRLDSSDSFTLMMRATGASGFGLNVDNGRPCFWLDPLDGDPEPKGTAWSICSSSSLSIGSWHHIAATLDKFTGEMRLSLFVDGLEDLASSLLTSYTGGIDISPSPFSVGCSHNSDADCVDGAIDEVIIHSVAKSPDYIYRRANPGVPMVRFLAHTEACEPSSNEFLDYTLHWANPDTAYEPPVLTDLNKTTECVGLLSPCLGYAGWWRFNEGSGIAAIDSSSSKNNGVASGDPFHTQGMHLTAIDYDGTDDFVAIPGSGLLTGTEWTYETWMLASPAMTDCSQNDFMMSKNVATQAEGDTGIWLKPDNCSVRAYVITEDGTAEKAINSSKDKDDWVHGEWYGVSTVWSGTSFELFVGNESQGDISLGNTVSLTDNGSDIVIGRDNPDSTFWFDSALDSIRIMSRALTTDEFLHNPLAEWEYGLCADVNGDMDGDCDGDPTGTDCDDTNPNVHAGADETCGNGVDDDCDGDTDEDGGLCPDGQTCVDGQCVTDGFVAIPAGLFWMGSPQSTTCPEGYPGVCEDESGSNEDENLHYVKLTRAFEMQVHEVRQDEWKAAFDNWNPSNFPECGDNCPVESVSWFDAVAYANEKSKAAIPALTPCYEITVVKCEKGGDPTDGSDYMFCMDIAHGGIDSATVTLNGVVKPYECSGYRLPTESEWEYAARAGSNTAFYPSPGNDGTITYENCTLDPNLAQIGWNCGNDDPIGTKPVGGKESNAWGLYDMSGNVWEWAWDGYEGYPAGALSNPDEDPVGMDGTYRVLRGGGWDDSAQSCRSANRDSHSPSDRYSLLGLRLSRTLPDVGDNDLDEVFDDGDGNGTPGDNPCTGGETALCDDNCPGMANPDQVDADGDGFGAACDCDDSDETIYTGATEACNGKDDDCDGATDELKDNGDGTFTDPCTGLVWQNPPYDGTKLWDAAKQYCTNNEAGLPGTGWHLPNISELRSLIRGCPNTETGGACGVTDVCSKCGVGQSCLSWNPCHDDCSYCSSGDGPADGCYWPDEMEGICDLYWSSSPVEDAGGNVFYVGFNGGAVNVQNVSFDWHVRCVR